jgi:hypothetical protein
MVLTIPAALAQTTNESSRMQYTGREEYFKKLDANRDGIVSLQELESAPDWQKNPLSAEEYFKKLDSNGDGGISLDEYTTRPVSTSQVERITKASEKSSGGSSVRNTRNYPHHNYAPTAHPLSQRAPATSAPAAKSASNIEPKPVKKYMAPSSSLKTATSLKPATKTTTSMKTQSPASPAASRKAAKSKEKKSPYTIPASS